MVVHQLTRKQKRKAKRKLIKAKNVAFKTKRPLEEVAATIPGALAGIPGAVQRAAKAAKVKKAKKKAEDRPIPGKEPVDPVKVEKERKEAEKSRRKQQRQLAREEEAEAKRFARKLGLNKRRNKATLPASFTDAGLDYILDVCDRKKRAALTQDDLDEEDEEERPTTSAKAKRAPKDDLGDSDSEPDEVTTGRVPSAKVLPVAARKPVSEEDDDDEESADDDDDEEEDGAEAAMELGSGEEGEEDLADEAEDSGSESGSEAGEASAAAPEDMYGRSVDASGHLVGGTRAGAQRLLEELDAKAAADVEPAEAARLAKLIRGLVNRISEGTLARTAKELGALFSSRSRGAVRETLATSLTASLGAPFALPDRLLMEMAALVALLHSNVSTELAAHLVEKVALKLDSHCREIANLDDRAGHNALNFIAHLYNFKIVKSNLVLELMDTFLERFAELDVEFLLVMFKNIGFVLRKDSPQDVKDFLLKVQAKISSPAVEKFADQSKVRFMLEALAAIRNNNSLKLERDFDGELLEHLQKLVRGCLTKGSLETALPMGWKDLLSGSQSGRWWLVGSAWAAPAEAEKAEATAAVTEAPALLVLAAKYRMNTELRRRIFCALMAAEDFLDGVERVLKLKLSGQEEREIVHIAVVCCLKEATFNPFYALFLSKLSSVHRRFGLTLQYAVWDRLKELDNLKARQRRQLASLTAALIRSGALTLASLRVMDFASLSPVESRFLRNCLSCLLRDCDEKELRACFEKLMGPKQRAQSSGVVQGLRLILPTLGAELAGPVESARLLLRDKDVAM